MAEASAKTIGLTGQVQEAQDASHLATGVESLFLKPSRQCLLKLGDGSIWA